MPAESAPPVGGGSAVAQKDNTSLVMLTEGQLLCSCLLEVLMSKMAKRQAMFLKGLGCPHPGEPALSLEEWNEPLVTILKIPTVALY